MKAVLISIKPKWCELILSGEKTVEVRKTKPNLKTPFKCYIYQTKSKDNSIYKQYKVDDMRCGKVIGEFICDKIDKYTFSNLEADYRVNHIELDTMRLNYVDLIEYGKGNPLYGWQISNLKIYDEPKSLREFGVNSDCAHNSESGCTFGGVCFSVYRTYDDFCRIPLTRPPQSWCYVEDK